AFLLRIPANMIDMQMGAEYEIDRGRIDAGLPQPVEEAASAPLMPGRDLGTIFAFADAAIDEDCSSLRSKHEALDREPGLVAVAHQKFALQHAALCLDHSRIELRQELRERKTKVVVIHDDVDDRITDRKTHGELLLRWSRGKAVRPM